MFRKTIFSGLQYRLASCFLGILFMCSFTINAQQLDDLVVSPIENQLSSIPVFVDFPDDAAIIITSSLTNLRFDSNVEIIADRSEPASGEYRLIIPPFRQTIAVYADNYKQLRFTVPVSEARQVLFYSIEPKEEDVNVVPTFFAVSPAQAMDATVFIDDQVVDINRAVNLEEGTHQLRIEKTGYRTITEEIIVSADQNIRKYEMEPMQTQLVTVTSSPENARIEINDVERGSTDYQGFLFPGNYFIRVAKNGYKTIQQSIEVVDGDTNAFHFELEEYGGDLMLTLSPSNARVSLNDQPVDLTNGWAKVHPGTYNMVVSAKGYETYSEPIVVLENEVIERNISLRKLVGTLQQTIRPIFATVTLLDENGMLVDEWQGANRINDLPVGTYTIEAVASDYKRYRRTITVREGQIEELDIRLELLNPVALSEDTALEESSTGNERNDVYREDRGGFFSYPDFEGMYLHYNLFEPNTNAFASNVEEGVGFGIGFYKHRGIITTSFDLVYNRYQFVSSELLPEEIRSYNVSTSLVPTLSFGPVLIGYGIGLDFTQYEEPDSQSFDYTYDAFTAFQITFKPKSWGLGFMIDNRKSWDIGFAEEYRKWAQLKYSIVLEI
ncbi:MAG: PEGA domain-containing protein [bacterium]|nr:PEGA domain-containing protein [bacterium]